MSPYRLLTLVPVLVVAILILMPSVDAVKGEEEPPKPWETYPDADYIITAAEDGSVLFSFQEEAEITEETPGRLEFSIRSQ